MSYRAPNRPPDKYEPSVFKKAFNRIFDAINDVARGVGKALKSVDRVEAQFTELQSVVQLDVSAAVEWYQITDTLEYAEARVIISKGLKAASVIRARSRNGAGNLDDTESWTDISGSFITDATYPGGGYYRHRVLMARVSHLTPLLKMQVQVKDNRGNMWLNEVHTFDQDREPFLHSFSLKLGIYDENAGTWPIYGNATGDEDVASIAFDIDTSAYNADPTTIASTDFATYVNARQVKSQSLGSVAAPASSTTTVYGIARAYSDVDKGGNEAFEQTIYQAIELPSKGSTTASLLEDSAKRASIEITAAHNGTTPATDIDVSGTISYADGTSYTISSATLTVGGTLEYIYFDPSVSATALQQTTTEATAKTITGRRIFVGVAQSATAPERAFFVFSGDKPVITAPYIYAAKLSALSADMGSLTAGQIVVTTGGDKIWLNEGDDGVLAVGGTTKASAPFHVAADGTVTMSSAVVTGYGQVQRATSAPSTRADATALVAGDIWIDTDDGDRIWNWDGAAWSEGFTVIDGGNITALSIDTAQLAAGAVEASKISVTDLQAVSTDTGTLTATGNITAGGMVFGPDAYAAGKEGIVLDAHNYWYDDASDDWRWKVGDTNNHVIWDGTDLKVVSSGTTVFDSSTDTFQGGNLSSLDITGTLDLQSSGTIEADIVNYSPTNTQNVIHVLDTAVSSGGLQVKSTVGNFSHLNLWTNSTGASIYIDAQASSSSLFLQAAQDVTITNTVGAYKWPTDTPSDGEVLTWNTGGTMSWETPSTHDLVTLAGSYNYLTLSSQEITLGQIDLTTDVTGTLAATLGGTGVASYTVGDILYASTTTVLSKLSTTTAGYILASTAGAGSAPGYLAPTNWNLSDFTDDLTYLDKTGDTASGAIKFDAAISFTESGGAPSFSTNYHGIYATGAGLWTREGSGTSYAIINTGSSSYNNGDWDTAYTHSQVTSGNPHSVSASDVGLGSVENTALSTWAGTTNVTTLGTIGTGTWQGTAIASAYLGAHSHGGSELNGFTAYATIAAGPSGTLTSVSPGTSGYVLTSNGASALPTYQAVASTLSGLSDTTITTPANSHFLVHNGTVWVNESASTARTSLGVDAAGTDNSTDVTLAGSYDYLTINGSQQITLGQIDLTTDVTGVLPSGNIGSHSHGGSELNGFTTYATVVSGPSGTLTSVGPGTSGYVLKAKGASTLPAYEALSSSDVGLGNVENTALSTWGGTANVVTLGTVSTGTWQGTAIASAYIGSHTHDKADLDGATVGGIIYGGAGGIFATTAAGTSGQYLKSAGASTPTWSSINEYTSWSATSDSPVADLEIADDQHLDFNGGDGIGVTHSAGVYTLTFAVDSTVVRTTGSQTISGQKLFSAADNDFTYSVKAPGMHHDSGELLIENEAAAANLTFKVNSTAAAQTLMYWKFDTTARMELNSDGDLQIDGTLTESSDRRLKSNIAPLLNSTSILRDINPVTYYKDGRMTAGLIAQEVAEVWPLPVYQNSSGYLGLSYTTFVPLLVASLKDAHARIDELETLLSR